MSHISENHIELLTIQRLEQFGYSYIYGPAIAPDSETPERKSLSSPCFGLCFLSVPKTSIFRI
jgi:hypothetical protein